MFKFNRKNPTAISRSSVVYYIVDLDVDAFHSLAEARRYYWATLAADDFESRFLKSRPRSYPGREIRRVTEDLAAGKVREVFFSAHGRFSMNPRKRCSSFD